MTGVGLIVLVSCWLYLTGTPTRWLPTSQQWTLADPRALVTLFACLLTIMFPLDVLGGFVLPNSARPNTITLRRFVTQWLRGVIIQGVIFLSSGLLILASGRLFGLLGATACVSTFVILLVIFQLRLSSVTGGLREAGEKSSRDQDVLIRASRQATAWGWRTRPVVLLTNRDSGFTGGIVGLPRMETIVLPATALKQLSPEQLAVTVARRLEAIQDGSRTRGLLFAFAWVLTGFTISALLPDAGVGSVAELATTCLGFTLWTFVGLLVLPSLSRQASFAIDTKVLARGASPEALHQAVKKLDQLQDDEPKRPALIETIFHPVPSVERRRRHQGSSTPIAWHAARMTLFFSWACMGTLSRAVHCNVGRTELWVMLPTD